MQHGLHAVEGVRKVGKARLESLHGNVVLRGAVREGHQLFALQLFCKVYRPVKLRRHAYRAYAALRRVVKAAQHLPVRQVQKLRIMRAALFI